MVRTWSLVVLAACGSPERTPAPLAGRGSAVAEPEPGIACIRARPRPGQGLNPLTENQYTCFETRAACARAAAKFADICVNAGPAHWSCMSMVTQPGDPTSGVATCLPTEDMCQAARPRSGWASFCFPAPHVVCSTTDGALDCADTAAGCELHRSLLHDVMHVDSTPCRGQ